jgi:hypothetical protein
MLDDLLLGLAQCVPSVLGSPSSQRPNHAIRNPLSNPNLHVHLRTNRDAMRIELLLMRLCTHERTRIYFSLMECGI